MVRVVRTNIFAPFRFTHHLKQQGGRPRRFPLKKPLLGLGIQTRACRFCATFYQSLGQLVNFQFAGAMSHQNLGRTVGFPSSSVLRYVSFPAHPVWANPSQLILAFEVNFPANSEVRPAGAGRCWPVTLVRSPTLAPKRVFQQGISL